MDPNEKITILLADDNDELLQILSALLSEMGYRVLRARDGEQAIVTLHETTVHLVILDLKMPKVDGWDVLVYVKQQLPSVRVVVLTAYGSKANALRAKEMGADELIQKPFDVGELFSKVNRILNLNST
ncbi:MAG: response regulator [Ignavibacteriae bacterium]|nr:response regulator [Ignavibacteriota bacterium]